jgi:hypothetical protein
VAVARASGRRGTFFISRYSSVPYILGLGMMTLVHLLGAQGLRGAELMRYESYACKMLESLHLLERFKERPSIADCTVIRHENRILSWKERHKAGADSQSVTVVGALPARVKICSDADPY